MHLQSVRFSGLAVRKDLEIQYEQSISGRSKGLKVCSSILTRDLYVFYDMHPLKIEGQVISR